MENLENIIKEILKKQEVGKNMEDLERELRYAILGVARQGEFNGFTNDNNIRSRIEKIYENKNAQEIREDIIKVYAKKTKGDNVKIGKFGEDTYNINGKWFSFKEIFKLYLDKLIIEIAHEKSNDSKATNPTESKRSNDDGDER